MKWLALFLGLASGAMALVWYACAFFSAVWDKDRSDMWDALFCAVILTALSIVFFSGMAVFS